jgi:hypothetical protein
VLHLLLVRRRNLHQLLSKPFYLELLLVLVFLEFFRLLAGEVLTVALLDDQLLEEGQLLLQLAHLPLALVQFGFEMMAGELLALAF